MRTNNGHIVGGLSWPKVRGWEGHVWNGNGWDVARFENRREAKSWVRGELAARGLPRLTGHRRKGRHPVWTRAMRKKAAEDGAKGDRAAKARGAQLGGLVSWGTRSDEERRRILAMLRAGRQPGWNKKTPKARKAQAAKAKERWALRAPMSAKQAEFLYDIGVLKGGPMVERRRQWPQGRPNPADFATLKEWKRAADAWDREHWQKMQRESVDSAEGKEGQ